MNRQSRASWTPLAAIVLLASVAAGCGKKGPPLAPFDPAPRRIEDLVVRRLGADIYLQFTIPTANQDATTPADVRTVEVYGLTGRPVDLAGKPLPERELVEAATLVGSVDVEPPAEPPDDEGQEAAAASAPPAADTDPRPAQGERVTVVERIVPGLLTEWTPLAKRRPPPESAQEPAAGGLETAAWIGPPVPRQEKKLARNYAVAARSGRGRLGALSGHVAVRLDDVPPTPASPKVTYDEAGFSVEWPTPPGVRRPVQAAAGEGMLPSRPLFAETAATGYNIYAGPDAEAASSGAPPVPLNTAPLAEPRFRTEPVEFGATRCFAVRTVFSGSGESTIESAASPATCVTPRDTFAPAAPRNLAAVGGEGAINLIWEPNSEADLAGYLVLRGDAAGAGTLQPVTPAPVKETTFRDATVQPGMRYVYTVVAVDTATPRNVSAQSNRIEETAR